MDSWASRRWDENAFYRANGLHPEDGPDVIELAMRLFGLSRVVTVPGLRQRAVLSPRRGEILLRPGLSPAALTFLVGHEIGEWVLERDGYREDDRELACDTVAASLCAPSRALRLAFAACGLDLPRIARSFHTSETILALRLGEVTLRPVAVTLPGRLRFAGAEWGWPPEPELRDIARGRLRTSAIERRELSDAPARAMLAAE